MGTRDSITAAGVAPDSTMDDPYSSWERRMPSMPEKKSCPAVRNEKRPRSPLGSLGEEEEEGGRRKEENTPN